MVLRTCSLNTFYVKPIFKARDANVWQREFPVGFPVEVSALNSFSIKICHDVV